MVGRTKTAVKYKARSEDDSEKIEREEIEHLSHDAQLASFGGKASSGTHSFPFAFTLPADAPPTMNVGKYDFNGSTFFRITSTSTTEIITTSLLESLLMPIS